MTLEQELKQIERTHGLIALDSIKIFLDELKKEDHPHITVKEACYESLDNFIRNQAEYKNHYPKLKEEIERYRPQ